MPDSIDRDTTRSIDRDTTGRFLKGHPGGPGRPRNPVSAAIDELHGRGLEVAQRLTDVLAEQALKGNLKAADMVLQRVWPVRRGRPMKVDRAPGNESAPYAFGEHADVATAMLEGDITPQEAQAAARVLKSLQEQMKAPEERTSWNSYSLGKR